MELWSFLTAIWAWERAFIDIPAWPTQLAHLTCGANTDPQLGCQACGAAPVTARDTSVVSGPDTTFRNVAVPRHHRRTVRDREPSSPESYRLDTLEILGDRWSTVLLVAAFLRVRRFADFSSALGIAPGILSDRLRRFIELDVLSQRGPEYRLTAKGLGFFPVFAFLVDWAQRWYAHPDGGGLTITHEACGQPLRPYLRCSHCAARWTAPTSTSSPAESSPAAPGPAAPRQLSTSCCRRAVRGSKVSTVAMILAAGRGWFLGGRRAGGDHGFRIAAPVPPEAHRPNLLGLQGRAARTVHFELFPRIESGAGVDAPRTAVLASMLSP